MLRRVNQTSLKLKKCRLNFAFSFVLSIKTGCLVSLCSRHVVAVGAVFHCFGSGFPLLPGKPGNAGGPRCWGWLGLFQVHFNLGWPLCAHTKEPASPFLGSLRALCWWPAGPLAPGLATHAGVTLCL